VGPLICLGIALLLGLFGLATAPTTVDNPITGEKQRVQLSPQQEVALGLQARSEMAAQYGGLTQTMSSSSMLIRYAGHAAVGSEERTLSLRIPSAA